jgi:hypothetical protein
MSRQTPQVSEDVKILAAIGHVCLQWARLEMALLAVIYGIEDVHYTKGDIVFGGLDMLPRVGMAVNLAEHHNIPVRFQKRIRAIRKALQHGDKNSLCNRRNQVVHGAHRDLEGGNTTLTMVRWRGPKRDRQMSALEINELAVDLCRLGDEAWAIFQDIGVWKFGPHRAENGDGDLAESGGAPRIKILHRLFTHLGNFWRKR